MSTEKAEITGTRPCDGLRVDLKRCLLQSDCCLKSRKTPLECLQTNEVAAECQAGDHRIRNKPMTFLPMCVLHVHCSWLLCF